MRRIVIGATVALALLGASLPSAAGSAAASFSTTITLVNPIASSQTVVAASGGGSDPGLCISQALSEQTGAIVRVVCRTGQFVSITARPDQRFVGTHGGAYNYYFGPGYGSITRTERPARLGAGTITSFRVYSVEEADGPLDLLVSF